MRTSSKETSASMEIGAADALPFHEVEAPLGRRRAAGSSLRHLRRLGRLLFVLNPAACWLFVRRGRRLALDYLHHLWTLFLWPETLPLCSTPPTLPVVPVETAFPGVDFRRLELLHALPRPGDVRPDELVILSALVRQLQPERLVEIGTAEGRTTLNLALHAPTGAEVITLDLPPEAPAAAVESGMDYRQFGIAEPGVLFLHDPLAARIRRHLVDSRRFDWKPFERSVDFAFIDGDHAYEGVRADSENVLGAVRRGGLILWHDYGVVDGVTRCLNELGRSRPVVHLANTSIACLRVGG